MPFIKQDDLDWSVDERPLFYQDRYGDLVRANDRKILVRSDSGEQFGIFSSSYHTVQPREILDAHAELSAKWGFEPTHTGYLREGRVIFTQSRAGDGVRLLGQDLLERNCLIITSYDGSSGTQVQLVSERVACTNQLPYMGKVPCANISHRSVFDAAKVPNILGLADDRWGEFVEEVTLLAQVPITPELTAEFLQQVWGKDAIRKDEKTGEITYKPGVHRALTAARTSPGANLRSANGTLWGLVNGVTYDTDHVAGRNEDTRQTSAWLGRGARLKAKAFSTALELARAA